MRSRRSRRRARRPARGAVFGGIFWTGGVVALGRLGGAPADAANVFAPDPAIAEIREILERLADAITSCRADSMLPSETAWGFKHALEQTLVEAGVAPERARQRRLFAAQWLESRAGDAREQRLEALRTRTRAAATIGAPIATPRRPPRRAAPPADRAHVLYGAAVRLFDLDDAVAKMDALYALGDLAARLGRTQEALAHFGETLRPGVAAGPAREGRRAPGASGASGTLGAHKQAVLHLELAQQLFDVAATRRAVAAALDDIGRIRLVGRPEASLVCHRARWPCASGWETTGRAPALARLGQSSRRWATRSRERALPRGADPAPEGGRSAGRGRPAAGPGGLGLDLGAIDEATRRLEEGKALARQRASACSRRAWPSRWASATWRPGTPSWRAPSTRARGRSRASSARASCCARRRGAWPRPSWRWATPAARATTPAPPSRSPSAWAPPRWWVPRCASSPRPWARARPARPTWQRADVRPRRRGAVERGRRARARPHAGRLREFEARVGRRNTALELRRQARRPHPGPAPGAARDPAPSTARPSSRCTSGHGVGFARARSRGRSASRRRRSCPGACRTSARGGRTHCG